MDTYRKYFNIDPEYFPAVNSEVIKHNPDLWKKFFPHETFIKLLKDTLAVLERKQKLNLWVEGAYGTGKSHAVLTLKHLLDASEDETREYFKKFEIDTDILNRFIATKKGGKIITVHRYGSSNIQSDNDLVLAMQESIEEALKEAGIDNAGPDAMRQGIIKYLADDTNKAIVKALVEGPYKVAFGNRTIDEVIEDLQKYSGEDLHELMDKFTKMSRERQIKIFSLDPKGLNQWITETIKANGLKHIVFIWDEFTEYFHNNVHRLTGFQEMLELSETQPFCFVQVTHQSKAIVTDTPKLLDRYIKPTCAIKLPDNMAFQLMGAAMQKNNDPVIYKEWTEDFIPDLEERTPQSRKTISNAAKIGQEELAKILPIHPYAASLLKYISEGFASNQRSMFDFIKNSNHDDEGYGFQWFIDNSSPLDPDPFLSIDMLWGFFYEKGKEFLSQPVRRTLDNYGSRSKGLSESEQRVLKAILLFQAMSEGVAGGVEAFIPTQKNLVLAFEGTDLDHDASSIAEKLVKSKVLYKKTEKDGSFQYSVHTDGHDMGEIDKYRDEFVNKTTADLISEGMLNEALSLAPELKGRFEIRFAGSTNLDIRLNEARNKSEQDGRRIYVVVTFAKDSSDGALVGKKFRTFYTAHPDTSVIIIDTSRTPLGREEFEKWVDHKATAKYFTGKNNTEATTYSKYALGVLSGWRQRVGNGNFVLYTSDVPGGQNVNNMDTLNGDLKDIDRKRFPLAPEANWNLNDTMWTGQGTALAVELGATQELKSQFKTNNKNRSIDHNFGGAWQVDRYWEKMPSLVISKIKIRIEDLIQKRLESDGRISIEEIYDFLKEAPVGILANNFLAFLLGFLLKEYATGEYTWSDGNMTDNLDMNKFKDMITEIIKRDINPVGHYRPKYIVTMTPEEKSFLDGTSKAFGISRAFCANVESTRDKLRMAMRNFDFPLWTGAYMAEKATMSTNADIIKNLISLYCELANNGGERTETEIALEIGKIFSGSPDAPTDLRNILNNNSCREGMEDYLKSYKGGELITLAKAIDDHGQYINALRAKYDAEAAKWVWKKETTDQRIDEVILEYKIAAETTKQLGVTCRSYKDAINEWSKKASNIRIPFDILKNEEPGITKLLSILFEEHKTGGLTDQQKESFLSAMEAEGKAFNDFYLDQISVFKRACNFYLNGLSDVEKGKIFNQISSSFYNDEGNYISLVSNKVAEFKKQQGISKLKNLWKEKSNTDSPRMWSSIYKMPIILMVPESETDKWQTVFDILNMSNPDEKQVNTAITALGNATFWDALVDSDLRDKIFTEKILKDNAIVLDSISEVKEVLMSHLSSDPYRWIGMPALDSTIASLVRDKYLNGRYSLAMDRIDSMDADDVKTYLKALIKSNPTVGIQIIKSK